jgi:glycosyltransferase involved in cell wall biosynthesis
MKLSCVIITYNEERNIKRCIESVKGVVDEIVVVDSFSNDRTKEICDVLSVSFVEHTFEGHIEQKNYAISQAKHPFILSLDADEALSENLKKSILEAKKNWNSDGYYFNRLTNYCGKWIKHCGWYPDQKLRLWDSRLGKWTGINPHDRFEMKDKAKLQFLKGDLLHYSYYTISQHIDQVNNFTEIGAREAVNLGKKSNLFKIISNPIWKFIRDYFFKLGFLDGYYGFVICAISAHATFIKYIKMRELKK